MYTRTPSVLGNQFTCTGQLERKGYAPLTGRLDPTPGDKARDPDCPSTATIKVNSSEYRGLFVVELRRGARPASVRVTGGHTENGGELKFENVCPGNYFFAFGPTDSDNVSVTRNFTVKNDGRT